MEQPKQFIGPKEVFLVSDVDGETTPIGSAIVNVTYVDGVNKRMPKALFNRLVTEEPIDLTALRDKWVDPVIHQTIVLMQEADIKMEDLDYFVNNLLASLDDKVNRANAKMFEVDFYPQRTILQIEKVLNAKPQSTTTTEEATESVE